MVCRCLGAVLKGPVVLFPGVGVFGSSWELTRGSVGNMLYSGLSEYCFSVSKPLHTVGESCALLKAGEVGLLEPSSQPWTNQLFQGCRTEGSTAAWLCPSPFRWGSLELR